MTDVISSILEFKPVRDFHWIINKSGMFSFEQMVSGDANNKFKFVPCSACQDGWDNNLSNHLLDYSKVTLCKNITNNSSADVVPPVVELVASQPTDSYGGVIVTLGENSTSSVIELGSQVQELKAIFLVHAETEAVLCYCILPEPIKVNNYLQLNYTDPIIEIISTVRVPSEQ